MIFTYHGLIESQPPAKMLESVGQVANLSALHVDMRQVRNLPHKQFLP